jgi:hypothetical protein
MGATYLSAYTDYIDEKLTDCAIYISTDLTF